MRRVLVLDVVGLTLDLLGPDTPHLSALAKRGGARPLAAITPAVTCSAQATFTTGLLPREHGIVGNGWYFRDLAEIWFWRQSNALVAGEKVWEAARRRDPSFTCAKLFWWYNMYASADWSATPRPMYPADGRKLPDLYTQPPELRDTLQQELGTFPLFEFWGPRASLASSRWIAECSMRVWERERPTLSLVYLPHLDYCLQKLGPDHAGVRPELQAVDRLCGDLIVQAQRDGARVIVLSEYGITPVSGPIHINRALREAGLLRVREERGRELLDAGASLAFAVSDHQIAHVYVRDPGRVREVALLLEKLDGVEQVLGDAGAKSRAGLDHPRSGEIVALSRADRWFSYYYWLDDARAPDFARTVDIHRKPGYDPAELYFDPALRFPRLRAAARLAQKTLGLRYLMDVIGLDASQVRGSHGRVTDRPEAGPLILSSSPELLPSEPISSTQVKPLILSHLFAALALVLGIALPASAPAADVGQCFSTPELNAAMKSEGQRAMASANKIAAGASGKPSARIGVTFTSDPAGKVGYVLNSDDAIGQKISRTCIVQKLRDVSIYDTEEPGVPAGALVKGDKAEALATCKRLPIEDGATCAFHNEALATLKTLRESALLQGRNEKDQLVTVTARIPGDGRGAMSISTATGAYILLAPLLDTSYTEDARARLEKAPAK